jgi:hypothetical protein
MGRTRDVSKILTSNTSILSLASASATYAPIAAGGLIQLIPSSATNGTIATNGTVSFTSASIISLDGIFSSTYEFYQINFRAVNSSSTQTLNFRLRASSSDLSGSNYYYGRVLGNTSTTVSSAGGGPATAAVTTGISTGDCFETIRFAYTQTEPRWEGNGYNSETSAITTFAGGYRASQAVSGISFYASSGNITGTLSVYGYRK